MNTKQQKKDTMPLQQLNRRRFIKTSAAAAAFTAASWSRVFGANERVGVGMIGFGLIGRIHTRNFKEQSGARIVAVAETYRPRLDAGAELIGGDVAKYGGLSPAVGEQGGGRGRCRHADHWHALMTMMACAAGKDVYVEKPLTLFVREGRWMVEVARRYKRIVQAGTQQRSGAHYQKARGIGSRRKPRAACLSPVQLFPQRLTGLWQSTGWQSSTGIGLRKCGSGRPRSAPTIRIALSYHFRWFWDYSRRTNDQSRRAFARLGSLDHRHQRPNCSDERRRDVFFLKD